VNPALAIGQIIVSIALVFAILLQARGTGLSGTFGGDSAVYRSRAPAVAVHDRPVDPVRRLLAGVVHLRADDDGRLSRLTAGRQTSPIARG
jgi:hypothetical protein